MYWMGSNSGNMRVINPSWLVINAQLLHAVEQAHIYKLRTDLSYSESLTIWVWLSVSMVGVVSWKPIPQLTTYHLKTGSWTNTALVILQKEHFSGTVICNFTSTLGCLYLMSCFSLPLNLSVCILLKVSKLFCCKSQKSFVEGLKIISLKVLKVFFQRSKQYFVESLKSISLKVPKLFRWKSQKYFVESLKNVPAGRL